MVYFDGILIYSKIEKEYFYHLNQIMMVLDKEKLFGNLKKCSIFTKELIFLGYVVTEEGIKVDESKLEAIRT